MTQKEKELNEEIELIDEFLAVQRIKRNADVGARALEVRDKRIAIFERIKERLTNELFRIKTSQPSLF